jgi:hypothetical protein
VGRRGSRIRRLRDPALGGYQYEREDGAVVHGDASGEWTLDEDGAADDIVLFASPRWTGDGAREKPE